MKGIVFFAVAALTAVSLDQAAAAQGQPKHCDLGNSVEHIVYIQFDNVHFRRDNPNVPSDLEQMPNLLNFLEGNGAFLTNHWTPLISHTAVDILTSLTGVYGDKFGVPIGNSFRYFDPDGTSTAAGSFAYWADPLDSFGTNPTDTTPQMIDRRGKTHPAPWVPFTRVGCDVGAFSVANIEFENTVLDINTVFGPDSPEAQEAKNNPDKAIADFEGIAVHCAPHSALCAAHSRPDLLPQEPGGYAGFDALFGNANVQPQISPEGPVTDLDDNVIADTSNPPNPGFPGFSPSASQTLGYLATMLESGIPVVYSYIADAHDNHFPGQSGTFGPGESGYVQQLAAYNDAFGKFFARLAADGITKQNTLFIVTSDENDHFAGGPASPEGCDGVSTPCTYANIGEVDANLSRLLFTQYGELAPFGVHADSAPTFYVDGNPDPLDALTRRLEREVAAVTAYNPITDANVNLTQALADRQEQDFLHMVTADPNRTPTFIMFADPDFFLSATYPPNGTPAPCVPLPACSFEDKGFAWNHGDFQRQITKTWLGLVGPGVRDVGVTGEIFSDHTDIRPTMISLTGLQDDYVHDGRVLFEILTDHALPEALRQHRATLTDLVRAYKDINAPLGKLGKRTLREATVAIGSSDASYIAFKAELAELTRRRDALATRMIRMIEDAEFGGISIDEVAAERLIQAAGELLESDR